MLRQCPASNVRGVNDIGYDRRAFAVAYIEAQKNYTGGLSELSMPYNEALREHRRQLLGGLERLFGVTLSGRRPTGEGNGMVCWLLDMVARSHINVRTPTSDMLEGGLLIKKLEETGRSEPVFAGLDHIADLADQSRQAHLDLLDLLLDILLDDRRDAVFTADDLRALGVDPTPPQEADFPDRDW